MSSFFLIPTFLALSGCNSDVESDFSLQLIPIIPDNQAPFADGPDVTLVMRDEFGDSNLIDMGSLSSGSATEEGLEPLSEVTLGLLLESPGGDASAYDHELLIAYGEAGPFSLSTGKEEVEARVLLPTFGAVGELGLLASQHLFASVAMTAAGDVYIFGGADSLTSTGSNTILKLSDIGEGEWDFAELNVTMAPDDDGITGRVASTATVVYDDAGQELILVAGGREVWYAPGDFDASFAAFLFDPATDNIVWEGEMERNRSEHQAVRMDNGNVMLISGLKGNSFSSTNTFEIFDVNNRSFSPDGGGVVTVQNTGFAIANSGSKGVTLCGGSALAGGDTTNPIDKCTLISQQGAVDDSVTSLSEALQWPAMAPLPNGDILITGGAKVSATNDGSMASATSEAWVLSENVWTSVGPMSVGRAGHAALALADGRVLIVGGVSEASMLWDNLGDRSNALDCVEIYDTDTQTFSSSEICTATGVGAKPQLSATSRGAFVFSGYYDANGNTADGAESYGIIGLAPNLETE